MVFYPEGVCTHRSDVQPIAFFKGRTTIVLSVRVCLDLSVGPLCVTVCCVADEVPVNVLLLD